MGRRALLWGTLGLSALGGGVVGLGWAALRTGAGRAVVVRAALHALNNALHGTVTIGTVTGSLTGGLDARDVQIRDEQGMMLARFPRLEVRYRLRDLLGGRVVLGQLRLTEPAVNLVKDSSGVFNYERVLGLDQPGSAGGRKPLIAFRDAEITGGRVVIQTPRRSDVNGPRDDGYRERVIDGLAARLPYVRISSPFRGEESLRFEFATLHAQVSDPKVSLHGARGSMDIKGDSMALDLEELRLANSEARVRGNLRWPDGPLLYDLDIQAGRLTAGDLRWIVSWFPDGLAGRVRGTVRSRGTEVVAVNIGQMALRGEHEGGTLRGRLELVSGPGDSWSLDTMDLAFDNFDLEYIRGMLDTLPVAGRLTGRLEAAGPREALRVELDWRFRDSLVAGWPETHVVGGGGVGLGVPGDFVFRNFAMRDATFDLGTVERLIPLGLRGELEGAGTLNGAWRTVEFSGTLRHQDDPLPASTVQGVLRVDARGDTVGVWADWVADSLHVAGLSSSYPWIRIGGTFGGDLRLAGYLDSLAVTADLAGPAGRIEAEGAVIALFPPWGAHTLDLRFGGLDLHALHASLPATALNGRVLGAARADSLQPSTALARVQLDSSRVLDTPIDSGRAVLGIADSLFKVDSADLWAPGLVASAQGALGLAGNRTDTLRITARTDALGVIEPVARWGWGREVAVPDTAPVGAASARVAIAGSLDRFTIRTRLNLERVRWARFYADRLDGSAEWHSDARGAVALAVEVDSLRWGRGASASHFTDVEARVRGRRDSLGWFGRARFGQNGSWIAGGRLETIGKLYLIPVDSMAFLLPSEVWFLDRGARVVVGDSAIALDRATFTSVSGAAVVAASGALPRAGAANLHLSLEGLPLADLWALLQFEGNGVGGEVSGTVDLGGTATTPQIRAALALSDVAFRGFRAPYLDGTVDYGNRRLSATFGLWRSGQRIVDLSTTLPIDLALRGTGERKLPGPLSFRVIADEVDLTFLEAMLPVVRDMGGRLSADFGIAGTWLRPELTGSVAVTDGAATFPALGVRHEGLNTRLVLTGDTIRVESLSVKSGEGTAAISGFVRLEELTRPVLNLRMVGNNFHTVNLRDFLTFTASGDYALNGPVFGAVLTGRGTVPSGVLYFKDLITKQVIELEDPRYADLIDTSQIRRQGLGEEFENRFLDSLQIDSLVLAMGSEVWMRSSEANIQLTGSLTVGKEGDRYRLDGTLETSRGAYRLPLGAGIAREFTVTGGRLQYFGTPDLNATVDIDARHVIRRPERNVTVTVHIGGTLYAPRLTFSSDVRPPISETEIISYLIFGVPSFQALAQGGGEVLNSAVRVLSGQIERSVITQLGIPLDYFQIRPGEALGGFSGTEIAVGKQVSLLGMPMFLTFSPRVCSEQASAQSVSFGFGLSAEFRLGRQWLVAASRDPVRGCATLGESTQSPYQLGLDFFWERIF